MNHGGLSSGSGMPNMQMPPSMQSNSGGIYDHMQPSVNINGVNMSPKADQHQNQMLQSQHLNPLPPQSQFLQSRNTSSVSNVLFRILLLPKIRYVFTFRCQFRNEINYFHSFGLISIRCIQNLRKIKNFHLREVFSYLNIYI